MLPNRTRQAVASVTRQLQARGVRGMHFTYAPGAHRLSRNRQVLARVRVLKAYLHGKSRPAAPIGDSVPA